MIAVIGASIFSIVIVLSFCKKEKYVMTPLSAISAVCFGQLHCK